MALFRLQITSIGRGEGRRATAAAAYRAGERIRDERSGEVHDYSRRRDVTHTQIILPGRLGDARVDWARDRSRLWNTAEHAEISRTGRVAREFQVSLPAELSADQRLELARKFSQQVADRYNIAVDLAIHAPRAGSDPRNFHAHLLGTTREVTATGLGSKAGLDMGANERMRRGLNSRSEEFIALRKRWADLTNDALVAAHSEARVDHRSLAQRGIDREAPAPASASGSFAHIRREAREEWLRLREVELGKSLGRQPGREVDETSPDAGRGAYAPDHGSREPGDDHSM